MIELGTVRRSKYIRPLYYPLAIQIALEDALELFIVERYGVPTGELCRRQKALMSCLGGAITLSTDN